MEVLNNVIEGRLEANAWNMAQAARMEGLFET